MKRSHVFAILALSVVLAKGLLLPAASALAGNSFELSWSVVGAGGGASEGGDYALQGTAGQPEAGEATGGIYTLASGYWSNLVETNYDLFIPVVTR